MATLDWLIIVAYLGLILGLAAWVFRRRKDTPDDYFLANRNLGWLIVGASIFASNIGSEHLVGLAGSGATDGVALAHFELHAWCLLVLGWVFVPFYMRSRVYTMPEFLERRFSPAARWVLSIISLVAYVLTKVAVGIFAGGIVFATLRTWNPAFGGPVSEGARSFLQDIGLNVFIAVLAANVGSKVIASFQGTTVIWLAIIGTLAALVPPFLSFLYGHYVMKMNSVVLAGACAGARNSTPSLQALSEQAQSSVGAIPYPVTYALTSALVLISGYLAMILS